MKTKEVMQTSRFFSITCDEVTTLDTQSWISIHGYVCQDWTRKPMLLSLERVMEGTGSDNLTTVIVDAIKNCGGLERTQLCSRFASFGAGKPFMLHLVFSTVTSFSGSFLHWGSCRVVEATVFVLPLLQSSSTGSNLFFGFSVMLTC